MKIWDPPPRWQLQRARRIKVKMFDIFYTYFVVMINSDKLWLWTVKKKMRWTWKHLRPSWISIIVAIMLHIVSPSSYYHLITFMHKKMSFCKEIKRYHIIFLRIEGKAGKTWRNVMTHPSLCDAPSFLFFLSWAGKKLSYLLAFCLFDFESPQRRIRKQ